MKKQNNILKYIAKITYSVALIASLYACTDEEIVKKNYIEEGIPVEVSMNFSSPEMGNLSTRGLDEIDKKKVNDLYIFIFNENGTERKEGSALYQNLETGKIKLKTTSGNSLIYAVANVINNQQQNLVGKLDAIKTLKELKECFTETGLIDNGAIDVDRTTPNMSMSGAYTEEGKAEGACEIQPSNVVLNLSGKIKLVRLDSHIKFKIKTGAKVKKFEPKTWQVCNVPRKSYIIAQGKINAGGINDYANSLIYNNQNFLAEKDEQNQNIYTFQFYQLENFKNSKNIDHLKNNPKDREKEVKDDNEKNTGEFAYVEPCATYVKISAYMELEEKDQQGNISTRIADITITILLGGKDSSNDQLFDPNNFNTWRNKKYTYNVTINDVTDILTEVGIDTDPIENRPGMEGDVIDAKGKARILDAHYSCFNIILTPRQAEEMSVLVHTPFDEVKYSAKQGEATPTPPSENENRDYKWIKFKYLGPDYTINGPFIPLATYKDNNPLLDIYQLRDDLRGRSGTNPDMKYFYTVFVDEYYYDTPPNGQIWQQPYWTKFVNQDDRYVMLFYTPKKSADGESSYSKADFLIRQKSIQTYYSKTMLTSDGSALGMEHVNETYKPNWTGSKRVSDVSGYDNCYESISLVTKDFSWNDLTFKPYSGKYSYFEVSGENYNTFVLATSRLNVQCLSRNRDSNGNGTIDESEMQWYVPTFQQISGMYLGATSLTSPLFVAPSNNYVYYNDFEFHFQTSDGDKIWAQEGCSNNGSKNGAEGYQMRCVRNLGKPATYQGSVPLQPYKSEKIDNHFVFDMSGIEPSNLRDTKVTGALGMHDQLKDTRNKSYKKFELAIEFMPNTKTAKNVYTWDLYYGKSDPCSLYSESDNEDDPRSQGKWRTPNQRELLIMYNTIKVDEMIYTENNIKYGMYSCTFWGFDNWTNESKKGYRIFGIEPDIRKLFLDNVVTKYKSTNTSDCPTILRCVRDI